MRKRKGWTKPKLALPTQRPCMMCGETFPSHGNGHRMCTDCRKPQDYEPYGQRVEPGVQTRDDICREVLGMKPKRRPQHWSDRSI